MATLEYRTFGDLVSAVCDELNISASDANARNRVKRDLNIVYGQVVAESNWHWVTGQATIQVQPYFSNGTASVTAGSAQVALTITPGFSRAGYKFAIDGYNEIYTIAEHDSNSLALTLADVYTGTTNGTVTFKIWQDRLALPVDCQDVIEITHNYQATPLDKVGIKEYRRIYTPNPRLESKPSIYHVGEYINPSAAVPVVGLPGVGSRSSNGIVKTLVLGGTIPATLVAKVNNGEQVRLRISRAGDPSYNGDIIVDSVLTTSTSNDTLVYTGRSELLESTTPDTNIQILSLVQTVTFGRYREMLLYPALTQGRVSMFVDYKKNVAPLSDDDDEPAIPSLDRVVLLYGALARGWKKRGNQNEAEANQGLFDTKLAKMQGKLQETQDKPKLAPAKLYLGAKRNQRGSATLGGYGSLTGGGGGSQGAIVTGTPNRVPVFSPTGEVTSSSVTNAELGYLSGTTSSVQSQIDGINALAPGKIYIGNSSGQATEVMPLGDVTVAQDGTTLVTAGAITDSKVATGAAIARNKLASGSANAVAVNNGAGVLTDSTVTGTMLSFLQDAEALTTVSLPDNTSAATVAASWTAATFNTLFIRYTLSRGSNIESGIINLVTDGTNASIAQGAIASLGTSGVTLTASVSTGALQLKYTTTATGTGAVLKYKLLKWLA